MKFNIKLLPLLCLLSLPSIADDANDYFEKALSSNRLGNVDEAYIYLKNALQQEPEHLPARILMGELYFKKGDMFSTEEVLSDALNNGADINLLIYYLGYSLLAQSKIEQLLLLEKHERSLTFDNKFEWTLLKAQAYEKLDNILYAQGFYDEAIRLKPTAFKAYNAYASLLIKESELEKAKSLIDQSFKLESNNAKTLSLLAEWHLKQSQIEPAIEALNKAFVFSPDDPKIMRLLAFTYMRVGNFEQAKTYLNIISDKYPQDASATLMQAWLLANKDQSSLAQESLDNLDMRLTLFTDDQLIENQTINYLKGSSEFIKGNYESAHQSLLSFLAETQVTTAVFKC